MRCLQMPDDPPLFFGKNWTRGGSSGMNPSDSRKSTKNIKVKHVDYSEVEVSCLNLNDIIYTRSIIPGLFRP